MDGGGLCHRQCVCARAYATAQACADTNILVKSTRRKHRSKEFYKTQKLFSFCCKTGHRTVQRDAIELTKLSPFVSLAQVHYYRLVI